jgi:hypothetical protein
MSASSDIDLIKVVDPRIDLHDKLAFEVYCGAQNVTYQQYFRQSASAGSQTYNIQLPSMDTVISSEVLIRNTITLNISGAPPLGVPLINIGYSDALAPFPYHQAISVSQSSINNNSVAQNTRDILAPLLRMLDSRRLQRYNGTCPVMPDVYQNYGDCVGAVNNPLGSYFNAQDNDIVPRGAFSIDSVAFVSSTNAAVPTVANGGLTAGNVPVGTVTGGVADTLVCAVTFTTTEPLLLSPFTYAGMGSQSGMMGITNLNFIFTTGDWSRCWRSAPFANGNVKSVSYNNISNSYLLIQYLTPHPSQLKASRNIRPFYTLDRYITNGGSTIQANSVGNRFVSNNLQMNGVPDKIWVVIRKPIANSNCSNSDSFFPITNVSITFNNLAGILSSATTEDLFKIGTESTNQSWQEFQGYANVNDNLTGAGRKVPLSGGFLCLGMGRDVNLPDEFLAPNSLGQFNLLVQATFNNNTNQVLNAGDYEMMIVLQNGGMLVNERGQTAIFQQVLTKNSVLDCKQEDSYVTSTELKRMVGKGFLDNMKVHARRGLSMLPGFASKYAKEGLRSLNNPYADAGAQALQDLGMGKRKGGKMGRHLL